MAVRITPLEINPQNSLLNVRPLNDAFTNMRKANEFDEQQRFRYDELDTRKADIEHRRRNDDARLGLERQRVGIAERAGQRGDQDRAAQIFGNMAAAIDAMPEGSPERSAAWAKLVGSDQRMPTMLTRYGQNPNDHINGPRFLMAQTMDPVSLRQMRTQTQPRTAEEAPPQYRINDQGELEREEADVAGYRTATHPAAMRFPAGPNAPAIAGPREVVPAQSLTPDTTTVPGVTLNRPLAGDRNRDWSGGQREADTQALWPRVQQQDRSLTTPEINRAWTAMLGRQPKAGHIYNLRGQEVPNTPPEVADRTARAAQVAAINEAITNVQDARDAIRQTSWVGRQVGHATGIGQFARVLPVLDVASRAIMHGLSGAQVNIPETEAYARAFKPQPGDSLTTIETKLAHMQGILGRISMRGGGPFTEDDKLLLRNQMRQGIGLRPLSMQQHINSARPTNRPPEEPPAPGEQPRQRPRGAAGTGNPLQDMSDEELLRQLQGR